MKGLWVVLWFCCCSCGCFFFFNSYPWLHCFDFYLDFNNKNRYFPVNLQNFVYSLRVRRQKKTRFKRPWKPPRQITVQWHGWPSLLHACYISSIGHSGYNWTQFFSALLCGGVVVELKVLHYSVANFFGFIPLPSPRLMCKDSLRIFSGSCRVYHLSYASAS